MSKVNAGPEIRFEISRGSFYAIRDCWPNPKMYIIKKRVPKMNAYLKLNICLSHTLAQTNLKGHLCFIAFGAINFSISIGSVLSSCCVFSFSLHFCPEFARPALNYILFMLMPDEKNVLCHTLETNLTANNR